MMDLTLTLSLGALFGYALGSIPFGLLLTRLAGLGDIREIGSGNIGATNVLRTGNKPLALVTFLTDAGKGGVAALLMSALLGPLAGYAAGVAAFIGHIFPVWLNFRGGKGISTYIGILLAFSPLVALGFCTSWLLTALVFRISSLAALVACAFAPVSAYLLTGQDMAITTLAVSLVAIWAHRANIKRLLAGTEPRIGKRDV